MAAPIFLDAVRRSALEAPRQVELHSNRSSQKQAMDLDVTYLIQLGLILCAVVIVNGLLLRPVLKVILLRQEKIEGAHADALRLTDLGDGDQKEYQARMREARDAASRERETLRSEGRDEERKLLNQVRADLAKNLAGARGEIRKAEDNARLEIADETQKMSRSLVHKILGREVSA